MTSISSKSKQRIIRLLVPPTQRTGYDVVAPRGLTVRSLIHHRRYAHLRDRYTVALTVTGHLLCLDNLVKRHYDLIG